MYWPPLYRIPEELPFRMHPSRTLFAATHIRWQPRTVLGE